jgi:hypothetical protein
MAVHRKVSGTGDGAGFGDYDDKHNNPAGSATLDPAYVKNLIL